MRIFPIAAAAFAAAFIHPLIARAAGETAGEIVVANRYLLANQTSHAHLYLYREDGKLLRQLSRDNSGQDRDPVFAPDGASIAWTRELPGGKTQFWSISPLGKNAQRLSAAPVWYGKTKPSPYFTSIGRFGPELGDKAHRFRTPDGATDVVLQRLASDDEFDGEGTGKHYFLRDVKSGVTTDFEKLPGFVGTYDLMTRNDQPDQTFLWQGPLHVAFFSLHLDSTDGTTVFALDFSGPRLVRLAPNWAAPFILPDQSAFLSVNFARYVPIPKSQKTANCRYIERFDETLKKVRYSNTNCTICYGASLYSPSQTPQVVTIGDLYY